MNHGIYRLVFNVERNAWVAVAEFVRGRGKKSARKQVAAVILGVAAAGAGVALAAPPIPPSLSALPVPSSGSRPFVFNGAVTGGAPTTAMVNGINTMTVPTASRTVGLNWDSFNVGGQAAVEYTGEALRILNRIWSNDPSQIMGRISAPGKELYYISQNGILFGNGAQVNVGGLVASSLNMTDAMASKLLNYGLPSNRGDSLEFVWDGSATGFQAGYVTVDAGARITTPSGGKVVLIAPRTVTNLGLIESGGNGEAILAAGGKVILTAPDDPNLRGLLVETQAFNGRDSLGNSVSLDGVVSNQTDDQADPDQVVRRGRIDMGADGVVTLAALAVNQQGIVNATKAVNLNGTTILVGTNKTSADSLSGSGTTDTKLLTINQRGSVAEIDWGSGFSVGSGSKVEFVQSSAGAVAYNIVYDPDWKLSDGTAFKSYAGRSFIDGVVEASGQFVLVNEKGIQLGSSAKVKATSLVLSALGMNPDIKLSGLLGQTGVTDRAFYLYQAPSVTFAEGEAGLEAKFAAALDAYRSALVDVRSGAEITSRENGYAVLAGGQIKQGGTIRAGLTDKVDSKGNALYKGGQVVMAAGADLYLKPGFSAANRGFFAEVNPLVALRTSRYQRDANGDVVNDANGNPVSIQEDYRWIAISRGELNSNRVLNSGFVGADFGDITLVGNEVVQAGILRASTSATLNGSIHLLARDTLQSSGKDVATTNLNAFYRKYDADGIVAAGTESLQKTDKDVSQFVVGTDGGTLTFADGSQTIVAIDGSDGKTLTSDQNFLLSSISGLAKKIIVGDADIEARGGEITLRSQGSFGEFNAFSVDQVVLPQDAAAAGAAIYVSEQARLDVSGTNAAKSAADLFIEVELRGDEFADNPVQRDGKLRGEKAWVDTRDPVSIANISGWEKTIGRSVNELAGTGGKISLASTGSVIVKKGAELDVSGGTVNYAAATVKESLAITYSGDRYRLNDAPVSARYAGLVSVNRDVATYVEGKSAGTVEVIAHNLAVDGNLKAETTIGTRQRLIGNPDTERYARPYGGQLIIRDAGQHFPVSDRYLASEAEKMAAYSQAQIAFVKGAANASEGLGVNDSAGPVTLLSQSLIDNGFSRINVSSDGRIDLPADVSLMLGAGGTLSLSGRQLYVAGDVSAPSGSITLKTRDMSSGVGSFPTSADAKYSSLILDSGASLSTAGQWVNDSLDRDSSTVAKAITGGSIKLSSAFDLDIRSGSVVDVSGGAWVKSDKNATVKSGNAGSVTLESGMGFASELGTDSIFLNGELSALSLAKGGTLNITTSKIEVGQQPYSTKALGWDAAKRLASGKFGIAFGGDFVDQGGFYNFVFTGRSGVSVSGYTKLSADPKNWYLPSRDGYRYKATGSRIADFATTRVLPYEQRVAPTELTLATTAPLVDGDILIGEKAYVGVSPEGKLTLEASGQMTILGTLEAQAGEINLGRTKVSGYLKDNYSTEKQSESIYLGEHSQILAGGTTVLTTATSQAILAGNSKESLLKLGKLRGEVLSGGSVNIDAGLGYVVTRAGSVIDVSGATGTLNTATSTGFGVAYPATVVGSAGGTVSIAAHAGMFIDGNFSALGGQGALGGVFSLSLPLAENPWGFPESNRTNEQKAVLAPRNLVLYQSEAGSDGKVTHDALWKFSEDAYFSGKQLIDPISNNGKAQLDLALLTKGGFGSWYLSNRGDIGFKGTIDAVVPNQLVLSADRFSANSADVSISLTAGALKLGNAYDAGIKPKANADDPNEILLPSVTTGLASATFSAKDIGIFGVVGWSGFADTKFESSGAIHFDGVLNSVPFRTGGRRYGGAFIATGDLTFSAARLSPATYSDFVVSTVEDTIDGGSITILQNPVAVSDVSLSPAGRLEFLSKEITHKGTVTAPLGEIVFSAPGGKVSLDSASVTSVAADRDLLFGYTTESGSSWKYAGMDVEAPPAKNIVIDAADTIISSKAKLDLSGGGELVAWEFSSGPGGKSDALAADANKFAIVPGWNGFSATDGELLKDYLLDTSTTGISSLKAGDRITLGNNPYGLTGSYVLLPARYALLSGAYLVTIKSTNDAVLGGAITQADGSSLVSGRVLAVNASGAPSAYSTSPLTVELAANDVVSARAKYVQTTATDFFFDDSGVRLAGDAGRLSVIGRNFLSFDPSVVAIRLAEIAASDGRVRATHGLELDLAASKLLVGSDSADAGPDWSVISYEKLNSLGAASILLGGSRQLDGEVSRIETIADQLKVDTQGGSLIGPELLFIAKQELTVKEGSRIESLGAETGGATKLELSGDSAFMRVAEGAQASVSRQARAGTVGKLMLEEGATVAGRSLIFDAIKENSLNGTILLGERQVNGARTSGGALAIGANRIHIVGDDASMPSDGLILNNTDLMSRYSQASELRLSSYTTLDLWGTTSLGSDSFDRLVISAGGIVGHGDGTASTISAKSTVFENQNLATTDFSSVSDFGTGSLTISSDTVEFASNATSVMRDGALAGVSIKGFKEVTIKATDDLLFSGVGVTRIEQGGGAPVDVDIVAGRVATAGSADHLLDVVGSIGITGGANTGSNMGLGGSLELRAGTLDISGRVEASAGQLTLTATEAGGIKINSGAQLLAEGRKLAFDDVFAYAPGGQITLQATATNGSIAIDSGARLSVSADEAGGDAGAISLKAEQGSVSVGKNTLFGAAKEGAEQGGLEVDAKYVSLDALADAVDNNSGANLAGRWNIRRREGDLELGKTIKSSHATISADNGGILVDTLGVIDASGSKGGTIELFSNNGDIGLKGNLIARGQEFITDTDNAGTRGQGGTVMLGASGSGKVRVYKGSSVDVDVASRKTGPVGQEVVEKSAASGGKVTFRANAPDFTQSDWSSNLNIELNGGIVGASDVGAEFVTVLEGSSLSTGSSSDGVIGLNSIKSTLDAGFSSGNLAILRKSLKFDNASVQHIRPAIEIRTPDGFSGDFDVATDLNFQTLKFGGEAGVLTVRSLGNLTINGNLTDGFFNAGRVRPSGQSWSYRLVAGADLKAANPLEVSKGAVGTVAVAAGKYVRTGIGDIRISASTDILLNEAAVYTAGYSAAAINYFNTTSTGWAGVPLFPTGGGDVVLTAGRDVEMASTSVDGRHINEWLLRPDNTTLNTQWFPQTTSFREGVAAFGGGDVSVSAGRDVKNLTVAIPTNGRVPRVDGADVADDAVIQGGGDLLVQAGGDIVGGLYYAETGSLKLQANALTKDVGIALGNTSVEIVAKQQAEIGNVFNPLMTVTNPKLANGDDGNTGALDPLYSPRIGTYGPDSSLDVLAVSGDVSLSPKNTYFGVTDGEAGFVMPPKVKVVAINGDIELRGDAGITQLPSTEGQLDLLANGSITFLNANNIRQLDLPASLLPSISNPITANSFGSFKLHTLIEDGLTRELHAAELWHANDDEPSHLIANHGDIIGALKPGNESYFSEAVHVVAGGDVENFSASIQHARSTDASSIVAGGDIRYDYETGSSTSGKTEVQFPSLGIRVGGPGSVSVMAGENIDLADTEGIVTRGNLDNPYLPEGGASITAIAGGAPDYDGLRNYFKLGEKAGDEAGLRDLFFKSLKEFGKQAQNTGDQSLYEKGRELIDVFFPKEQQGNGDILLSVSQIKSEQDGDIHLFAPTGSIVVGVADPSLTKKASQQGIFTVGFGNLYAYVEKNFLVNQSRVFTLDGGEIVIWSNHGDIDAGSGSKTAISTPPPALVIRGGQLVLDTSNSVSGSGIAVLKSRDDTPSADMSLFAPEGTIDAGDAGLRSTGNITLGARTILNASNIQAGGSVSGAPAPVTATAPVAAVTSPTNNENKALEDAAPSAGKRDGAGGMLTVEVLDSEPAADPATLDDEERKRKARARAAG